MNTNMRKDQTVKTYGRHRNRVIAVDIWSSDNGKKATGVFSTSSELDSPRHTSSIFHVSSSSELGSKLNSTGNTADNSDFAPVVRKSTRHVTNLRRRAGEKENAKLTKTTAWQKAACTSTDSSNASENAVRTRPHTLRERNRKIDYNDSANLKKQLRGTMAKTKRPVRTCAEKDPKLKGDFVNFSEFDDYSLVITDASGQGNPTSKQVVMETSTPVAKRTRCKDVSLDRIRNSDISHIEHIESPVLEKGLSGYSINTPESVYWSKEKFLFSSLISSPSIVSSVASLENISDKNQSSRTNCDLGQRSRTDCEASQRSRSNCESNVIHSPDDAVIQLERLRQSFISNHVNGRKRITPKVIIDLDPVEVFKTPESVVQLSRLSNRFIAMHITNDSENSSKSIKSATNHTSTIDNSASLFDSPGCNIGNNLSLLVANLRKSKYLTLKNTPPHRDCSDESVDESTEESHEESELEQTDSSELRPNLSAIVEYVETDDEEEDDDEDEVENGSDESTQNVENSTSCSEEMETSIRPSGSFSGTRYMLNEDASAEMENNTEDNELLETDLSPLERSGGSDVNLQTVAASGSFTEYRRGSGEHETDSGDAESLYAVNEHYVSEYGSESEGEHSDVVADTVTPQAQKIVPKLRNHQLQSLQNSFSEMLTPTRSRASLVPMSACAKILLLCDQVAPITFRQSIPDRMMSKCKKIGEGVYGEVYRSVNRAQSVALKVIPIEGNFTVNDEPQKKFEEILPEVVIAKELSALRLAEGSMTSNFCEVYSVSLVKGKYPAPLLKQWDAYHKAKGSENDRPDVFKDNQLFMIFEFADCGSDLESYKFDSLQQAKSALTQVAYSLAVAEEALQFEHRDLHWGNVLVRPTRQEDIHFRLAGSIGTVPSLGVEASIIDFTLSRLTKDGCTVYTDLATDDSLFAGEGDYQFDIYRKMKEENGNNWKPFHSRTNVLWLHYLSNKLIYFQTYPSQNSRHNRDFLRQFRQFHSTILDYNSAIELVIDSLFLNS